MKAKLAKLSAFLFAMIVCLSLAAPVALAADDTAEVPNTAAAADTTTPPAAQTDAQDAVAQFKAEVIRLVNVEREKAGVADLKSNDALYPLADTRAKESAESFSHTRPDGTRCFTIFGENNLKYTAAGENLAYGYKTPADVVAAWMNSEGHRRNILDPDFKFIGIGYYVNDNGRVYCSELFYTPKSK